MAIKAAICTQCGAKIEIDDSKEAGICQYCGTAFITEKVINNFNNIFQIESATLNISGVNIDNLLLRAKQYEDEQEYEIAVSYYNRVLDIDANEKRASDGIERINRRLIDDKFFQVFDSVYSMDDLEKIVFYMKKNEKIKAIREFMLITNVGLANAKYFVENYKPGDSKDRVMEIISKFSEENASAQKKGCYIATSVYGSYDCPEVWVLRRYRDNILSNTKIGRMFIHLYYAISPSVVSLFGTNRVFQSFFRKRLDDFIFELKEKGIEDTPYKDR